jgi:hypothetical protein
MLRQKIANCSRPASCIEHTLVFLGHCDAFDQPEFCLMPEALGRTVGLQGAGLIVSANLDGVPFPPF